MQEVLEGVQFSFAEGGQSLNFAEAALLIQGSACIYSKKVEYLHSLVYQALEFIAERRQRNDRSHKDGGLGETDGGAENGDDDFEDEEQFLSLDDVLEEGTAIDLDEEAAGQIPAAIRPPATLLALEDTGTSLGDGDAGNYRIASSFVHRSGALLLEQRDGQGLDEHLQPVCSEVAGRHQAYWDAGAQPSGAAAEHEMQDWDGDAAGTGFDDHDDDYFDGADYYDNSGGNGAPEDANMEGVAAEAQQGASMLRVRQQQLEEEFDPYKPLDPNSRGDLKPRPFKKAAKVPQRPRARQQHRQQQLLHTTEALLNVQAPASGQLFPEFSYAIIQQESAKPSQTGQHLHGSRATSQRSAQTATAFTYEEAVAGFAPADDDGNDGADYYDGGDIGFDDDDDFAPLGDFAMPDITAAVETGSGWLDNGGGSSANPADSDDLTYEELCRAHIEAFISAAAAAEVQTELASRVSGWRAKMAPMLEEEDARPDFDIHMYGGRILQRMAELTCSDDVTPEAMKRGELDPLTFGQIVSIGPKYEASRSFSSMLQLINNGNVRITKLGGEQEQAFTLTLLDRVLPHEKVTDYRALGGAAAHVEKAAAAAATEEHCALQENLGMEHPKVPKKAKVTSGKTRGRRR